MKEIPAIIHVKTFYGFMLIIHYVVIGFLLNFTYDVWVFLFLLISLVGITLRWRIRLNDYTMLIDVLMLSLGAFFDIRAIYFIVIVLYQLSFRGKSYFSLLFIAYLYFGQQPYELILLTVSATVLGYMLHVWRKTSDAQIKNYDYERMQKYELIYDQNQLEYENMQIEHQARQAERQKIAEMLHDNLGHELSAASLSLQAHQTLVQRNDVEAAHKHLETATLKVQHALESLKEAVKTIEPVSHQLNDQLIHLIKEFPYPIDFKVSGSIQDLSVFRFQMIVTITKEALTNIMKHAKPKQITYTIEINDYIIRLIMINDGILKETSSEGHGLRYMRKRIETLGGTLSIQKNEVFRLLVTLPTKERES